MDEEQYKEDLAKHGVELPEVEAPAAEEPKEPEALKVEPEKEPAADEPKEPLIEPKPQEQKRRSIYDDLKDRKAEVKTERERADIAEKALAELQAKVGDAETPKEKKEAMDDIEAFASEIGTDPEVLRKLKTILLKDVPQATGLSDDDRTLLAEARASKEKQLFEAEFQSVIPSIKERFPSISDAELETVRKEVDAISHTKEWHDKDLDYIVFKHIEQLSNLVSPHRRGMESSDRKKADQSSSTDFDISADYGAMNPEQRKVWEAEYARLTKADGLIRKDGKLTIL